MISFEKIKQRKKKMESPTTSGYRPNIKNITSLITMNVMETFLSSINNTEDVNYFGTNTFGIYETFVHDNSNRPEYIKKISGIINENIIPQYKDLKSLKNYLNQSDVFNVFEESVEDFIYCDRVIKNDRSINKRKTRKKPLRTMRTMIQRRHCCWGGSGTRTSCCAARKKAFLPGGSATDRDGSLVMRDGDSGKGGGQ